MLLGWCEIFNYKNGGRKDKKLRCQALTESRLTPFILMAFFRNFTKQGTVWYNSSLISEYCIRYLVILSKDEKLKGCVKKIMLKKSLSSSTSNKRQKSVLKVEKLIQKTMCVSGRHIWVSLPVLQSLYIVLRVPMCDLWKGTVAYKELLFSN